MYTVDTVTEKVSNKVVYDYKQLLVTWSCNQCSQ